MISVAGKKNEIIRVTDVIFYFQFVFNKLIKLIHVDIYEQLRSKVAERQALSFCAGTETADYISNKIADVVVRNVGVDYFHKNSMVYGRKEFPNIAFQNPAGSRVIF